MKLSSDLEAWQIVNDEDLWVFDKLLLSRRLGYVCGPKGEVVPEPGNYIVRPCVNLLGMGRGASIKYFKYETEHEMRDGHFWCEIFNGRHLSFDFVNGEQVLCVEGLKKNLKNLQRWDRWEKVDETIKLPKLINSLKNKYFCFNVEVVGGKIIEVHFRLNPDFLDHGSPYVIPVYWDEHVAPAEDEEFIMSPDDQRLGFYIKKGTLK